MCTASWFATDAGYELFFNRDERRSRLRAVPPTADVREGLRVLAPTDADAGGTWLAVHEGGLGVALLNAWHVTVEDRAAFRSRGLLVRDLASSATPEVLAARLQAEDLARYRGFTLLVLFPGRAAQGFRWEGRALEPFRPDPPLVSSSVRFEDARAARTAAFGRHRDVPRASARERALAFHRSQDPVPGPLAVCMRREDASTVSLSHVVVDAHSVHLAYADGPPDEVPLGPALRVARRVTEASS